MRNLGVIYDMKRRRRRLSRLYSGFFAGKRVFWAVAAIQSGHAGDIRSQVVAVRRAAPTRANSRSDWRGGSRLRVSRRFPGHRTGSLPDQVQEGLSL